MAARISPSTLVRRKTRNGVVANVDVEDEVRARIYGELAGSVEAVAVADSSRGLDPSDEVRPGACDGVADGGAAMPSNPVASDAGDESDELEDRLAAALLGELDPAAREEVLARAAVRLSAERARVLGRREGSPDPASSELRACARAGRARALRERPARARPIRACERSIARDDRVSTMPCYRVVIDRGRGDSRSHVEFSARAPSARGAVAANVSSPDSSVSAVNEVEPADRFSWRPDGSCECTPASFTNCPGGSALDAEGWCRECGLQVLPPRGGLVGSGHEGRRALFARRLSTRLARGVSEIAHAADRNARKALPRS